MDSLTETIRGHDPIPQVPECTEASHQVGIETLDETQLAALDLGCATCLGMRFGCTMLGGGSSRWIEREAESDTRCASCGIYEQLVGPAVRGTKRG